MPAVRTSPWDARRRRRRFKPDGALRVLGGRVCRGDRVLCGLKRRLRDVLWPGYVHAAAPRKANFGHAPKVGVRIEEQIDAWFRGGTWRDGAWVKQGPRPGRFEARVFCGLMLARGLRPVASQAPLARGDVGTRLDWIVADAADECYLIELKTGHNYGLRAAQGALAGFPSFKNTREQHAYFQLLWMWAVLRGDGVETEPWLVVVNRAAKRHFSARDSVAAIAAKIRAGAGGRLVRRLPARHRAVADRVLAVTRGTLISP